MSCIVSPCTLAMRHVTYIWASACSRFEATIAVIFLARQYHVEQGAIAGSETCVAQDREKKRGGSREKEPEKKRGGSREKETLGTQKRAFRKP